MAKSSLSTQAGGRPTTCGTRGSSGCARTKTHDRCGGSEAGTMNQRETYCDNCKSFQPLAADGNLVCGRCGFLIARRNPEGQMYCDNCDAYQPVLHEPLRPPLPE